MSLREIHQQFGPKGIREFSPVYDRIGVVTDDTQLTLFTAEGLADALAKSPNATNDQIIASVHVAYLRWLVTQKVSTPLTERVVDPTYGLIAEPQMHSKINASFTCFNSLTAAQRISEFATNDSKGNGAIMRIAPVGLVFSDDPMRAFRLAGDIALLTHGHPTASIAAGAFAMIIAMVTSGDTLDFAIENTLDFLQTTPGHEETTQAIIYAPWPEPNPKPRFEWMGFGNVAHEALAIALHAVASTKTTEEAIIQSVNHDGDSDTTGSLAGQLSGALRGVESLPQRWVAALRCRQIVQRLAQSCSNRNNLD